MQLHRNMHKHLSRFIKLLLLHHCGKRHRGISLVSTTAVGHKSIYKYLFNYYLCKGEHENSDPICKHYIKIE